MKSILFTALLIVIISSCNKQTNADFLINQLAVITPKAKFSVCYTMNNDGVKEGEQTTFYNQSLNEVSYAWDFGNGMTSIEKDPVITFSCGQFPVKLTVTGVDGRTDVYRKDLLVYCRGRNAGGRDNHVHTGISGE